MQGDGCINRIPELLKTHGIKAEMCIRDSGGHLFYSTEQVLRVFEKNAPYLNRAYLHAVLHCIFSHPWIAGNLSLIHILDVYKRQDHRGAE